MSYMLKILMQVYILKAVVAKTLTVIDLALVIIAI